MKKKKFRFTAKDNHPVVFQIQSTLWDSFEHICATQNSHVLTILRSLYEQNNDIETSITIFVLRYSTLAYTTVYTKDDDFFLHEPETPFDDEETVIDLDLLYSEQE